MCSFLELCYFLNVRLKENVRDFKLFGGNLNFQACDIAEVSDVVDFCVLCAHEIFWEFRNLVNVIIDFAFLKKYGFLGARYYLVGLWG